MNTLWVANSYAKINLGLHILDKLPNGYHTIETGFCFIEWSDRFEVSPSGSTQLSMGDSGIPVDEHNLIFKAVKLLREEGGLKADFKIKVNKRVPVGAGLGGGSSNAATIMRMLNKIENLGLTDTDLAELGKRLGADVPFFIHGKPGIGTGMGTELTPEPIQPNAWIVTVYPNFESSTVEAYQNFVLEGPHDFDLKNVLLEEPIDEWRYLLQNDLEHSVFPRHELVGNIKDQFYDFGAEYASMSGSGSSVFGIFDQDFVAIDAYESFNALGYPANLTRPSFSPDLGIYIKEFD